jgi:transposase-like protein
MDINFVIIDRRKEKRKIKCVMIIDETMITIKDERNWLWIAYI